MPVKSMKESTQFLSLRPSVTFHFIIFLTSDIQSIKPCPQLKVPQGRKTHELSNNFNCLLTLLFFASLALELNLEGGTFLPLLVHPPTPRPQPSQPQRIGSQFFIC